MCMLHCIKQAYIDVQIPPKDLCVAILISVSRNPDVAIDMQDTFLFLDLTRTCATGKAAAG